MVHGQRQDSNNFQLDGVANVSLGGNTVQARPNVDAVQEFKIQTSNFSAEFGRNSGSVVQVVTKSGTNSVRGSVWEFLRDDKFQARNFFATSEPPPLKQNQFGGTVGGPLTVPGLYDGRNRTFFFGAFEGFRLTRGLTRQAVVATAAERAGNFSFLTRPIVDPLTGLPFAGNVIPDNRISPAARQLLTLMPLPNIDGVARAPEQLRLVPLAGADLQPVHAPSGSHLQPEVVGVLPAFPSGQHRLQPVSRFGSGRLPRVSHRG